MRFIQQPGVVHDCPDELPDVEAPAEEDDTAPAATYVPGASLHIRRPPPVQPVTDLRQRNIPKHLIEMVPESVARENLILPIELKGDVLTCAYGARVDNQTSEKLSFILAKRVELRPALRKAVIEAINKYYGEAETESVDSMLAEFVDAPPMGDRTISIDPPNYVARSVLISPFDKTWDIPPHGGLMPITPEPLPQRRFSMFFHTVPDGQRVLVTRLDGTMSVVVGPQRIWTGWNTIEPMRQHTAHPERYLVVRYRDGRQEHLPGPAEVWFDPRVHLGIDSLEALQLAAKEAIVVYSKPAGANAVQRRLVYGPAVFVPQPGEWLHRFSWHASKGGSRGVTKVANALVFEKLWLMPDQMYHDVFDVRTTDDAVLTVRLMIFFELVDIDKMLETTHDPIGDFVNAATSDIVQFTGQHTFESFKRNTHLLNDFESYRQLAGRATQCGYRINKVVYRGYSTADALQQMHDKAIEARTQLQLDRATEEQAQQLENFKLDSQLTRSTKRRAEQSVEIDHNLDLKRKKHAAELEVRQRAQSAQRDRERQDAEQALQLQVRRDEQQQRHLGSLREMGVDLTALLTQGRADRIIEVRGTGTPHVHVDKPS
jgi:hypothetical protein